MTWKLFAIIFAILTAAGFSGEWRPFSDLTMLELVNLALSPLSALVILLYAWRIHVMPSAVWRMFAGWKAMLNLATAAYASVLIYPRLVHAGETDGALMLGAGFAMMLALLFLEWLGIRRYAEMRQDREEGLEDEADDVGERDEVTCRGK
ncbi:hypothetical protein [Agaricicola taiwanensis]|nr:hypothetical protein [Agaricicola taiwanensis]